MGDDGDAGTDSPDGVASGWIVGVSASFCLSLHHKIQQMASSNGGS